MHILHVLDHSAPLHSGYTFRTLSILEQQRRRGWETSQLTGPRQGPTSAEEEQASGFTFVRTPVPKGVLAALPALKHLAAISAIERRLRELVARVQPDVIHAHSPALNGMAAVRVGRDAGIPVVYEVRAFWEDAAVDNYTSRAGGPRYRLTRGLETHVLRRADAVTTICEGLKNDMVDRGIPAAKITVIPNAVNVDDFAGAGEPDAALARELGLEDAEVVGFIGSFYPYEGLDLLLTAVASLADGRPRLRVLLVGGGQEDDALRRRVVELGIEDRVVFTGRVPFEEASRYYDLIDLLAYPRLPSRLTETVTPLKPLEAMAMGKLLVASDVGGHLELIENGATGVLFRAGDADDLARKIVGCFDDGERRERIQRTGRRWVEEERTWERSVERYVDVYDRLATADPRPAGAS